jgi:hypothetical protein
MVVLLNLAEVCICPLGSIFGGVPLDLVDLAIFLFLEFHSQVVIGNFPTAMW